MRKRVYTLFSGNGNPVASDIEASGVEILRLVETADEERPENAPHYAVSPDGSTIEALDVSTLSVRDVEEKLGRERV